MPQVTAVCDLVCKSPGLWSPPSGTLDLNFWIAFVFFFVLSSCSSWCPVARLSRGPNEARHASFSGLAGTEPGASRGGIEKRMDGAWISTPPAKDRAGRQRPHLPIIHQHRSVSLAPPHSQCWQPHASYRGARSPPACTAQPPRRPPRPASRSGQTCSRGSRNGPSSRRRAS